MKLLTFLKSLLLGTVYQFPLTNSQFLHESVFFHLVEVKLKEKSKYSVSSLYLGKMNFLKISSKI